MYLNLTQMYLNIAQLSLNSAKMCLKLTQMCLNPTKMCLDPTQICLNPTQICLNLTQMCFNLTQMCFNPFTIRFHLGSFPLYETTSAIVGSFTISPSNANSAICFCAIAFAPSYTPNVCYKKISLHVRSAPTIPSFQRQLRTSCFTNPIGHLASTLRCPSSQLRLVTDHSSEHWRLDSKSHRIHPPTHSLLHSFIHPFTH